MERAVVSWGHTSLHNCHCACARIASIPCSSLELVTFRDLQRHCNLEFVYSMSAAPAFEKFIFQIQHESWALEYRHSDSKLVNRLRVGVWVACVRRQLLHISHSDLPRNSGSTRLCWHLSCVGREGEKWSRVQRTRENV